MSLAISWRCAVCKREHQAGDAPLRETLSPRYQRGKCRRCRIIRMFEPGAGQGRDLEHGRELRERGMAHTEETQAFLNPTWAKRFDAEVVRLALTRIPFTSEDVTSRVGLPPSGSSSAVGARINAAAQRKVISWTGQMRQAERPNQHAAILKIWRGN